jgi:hypothetical protein
MRTYKGRVPWPPACPRRRLDLAWPSPAQRRRLASSLTETGVAAGHRRFAARERRWAKPRPSEDVRWRAASKENLPKAGEPPEYLHDMEATPPSSERRRPSSDLPPGGAAGVGCYRLEFRSAELHAFHRSSLPDVHRTAAWSITGRRSTICHRLKSDRLYISLPRLASPWAPYPLLSLFPCLGRFPKLPWSPVIWPPSALVHRVEAEGRRWWVVLRLGWSHWVRYGERHGVLQ